MKQLLLAALVIASLQSCIKTNTIEHDIHDTILMRVLGGVDTVNHFLVIHDTVTRSSVVNDTMQITKHDTLYITTTRIDTLLRYFIDTAYLTKTVHDTVIRVQTVVKVQHDTTQMPVYDTVYIAKKVVVHDTVTRLQYLHDTVNYTSVVYLHDTIVRIDRQVTVDTVLRYNSLYPVPAVDSVRMVYVKDTTGDAEFFAATGHPTHLIFHSATFTSVIPSPDGTYQSFTATPRIDSLPFRYGRGFGYISGVGLVIVAPKMLCTVTINYDTYGGGQFELIGYAYFEQQPRTTWTWSCWGKVAANFGASNSSFAVPLDDVWEMVIH